MTKTPLYLQFTNGGEPAAVYFDLAFQEQVDHSSNVTSYPVENGANISDHIRTQPITFVAKVFVSNNPIADLPDFSRGALEQSVPLGGGPTGHGPSAGRSIMALQFGSLQAFDNDFIGYTYDLLQKLHDYHILVSVCTELSAWANMAITKLSIDRDKDNSGDGVTIDLEFTQITIINSETVNEAKLPEAQTSTTKGEESNDDVDDDQKSILENKFDNYEQGYLGEL